MKGRTEKGIILSPSSRFDATRLAVYGSVAEKAETNAQNKSQVEEMAQTGGTYLPVRIFTWVLSATPQLAPQALV